MNAFLRSLLAGPVLLVAPLHAADPAPGVPAAKVAAADAGSAVRAELNALVEKIGKKLQAGEQTKESLKAELAEFDALLERHKENKSDDAAEAAIMRAMLYLEVLQDTDKGAALFSRIKTDYPQSKFAPEVDKVLAQIAEQRVADEAEKAADQVRASLKAGAAFPNFEAKGLDGKPVSLAALKGKVVLIDFWATWCGPCVQEVPHVVAAYDKYRGKGFEVVGISLDRDRKALEKFIAERKMSWLHIHDQQNELAGKYGVRAIPTTYLIGADGTLVASGLRGEALEQQLEKLLK